MVRPLLPLRRASTRPLPLPDIVLEHPHYLTLAEAERILNVSSLRTPLPDIHKSFLVHRSLISLPDSRHSHQRPPRPLTR
jgi:hypothetical protein